jgi:hypothetical protein
VAAAVNAGVCVDMVEIRSIAPLPQRDGAAACPLTAAEAAFFARSPPWGERLHPAGRAITPWGAGRQAPAMGR